MTARRPSLVLVDLPPEIAGYLAIALHDLRNRVRLNGSQVPAELDQLQQILTLRASRGQVGSSLDETVEALHDLVHGQRTPTLLTDLDGAAKALGVHRSTVKRLVASHELRAVHIGKLLRFRIADLDDFVDRLR
jgi:excisionase family DNA binding protein